MKRIITLIDPDTDKLMAANMAQQRFQLDMACWVISQIQLESIEEGHPIVSVSLLEVRCYGDEINWLAS